MTLEISDSERSRLASYGVQMGGAQHNYTTPEGQAYLDAVYAGEALYWNDPQLKRVTILRLLSDRGFPFWDVSYCHGERQDGTPCRVTLPFDQLSKRKWKSEIIEAAKRDRVFAKGLGILDNVSTLQ